MGNLEILGFKTLPGRGIRQEYLPVLDRTNRSPPDWFVMPNAKEREELRDCGRDPKKLTKNFKRLDERPTVRVQL